MRAALARLRELISGNTNCFVWLSSGTQGRGGLLNQEINALIGVGPAGNSTTPLAGTADLGPSGPNAVSGFIGSGFQLTVNTEGAFFTSAAGVGYVDPQYQAQMNAIGGGTVAAQYFILIHELGHLVAAPGYQSDASPDGTPLVPAQKSNNDLVLKNCGSILSAAGGGPS